MEYNEIQSIDWMNVEWNLKKFEIQIWLCHGLE